MSNSFSRSILLVLFSFVISEFFLSLHIFSYQLSLSQLTYWHSQELVWLWSGGQRRGPQRGEDLQEAGSRLAAVEHVRVGYRKEL
jgi:hypothetical protein